MSQNIVSHFPYPMISLSILLHAHSQLSALQLTKGSFSFEDIQQALVFNVPVPKLFMDLNIFLIGNSTFFVELCPGIYQMNHEFIHQRIRFLENLLKVFDHPGIHIFNIPNKDICDAKNEILSLLTTIQNPSANQIPSVITSKNLAQLNSFQNSHPIQNISPPVITRTIHHSPLQMIPLDSSSSSKSMSRHEITPPMSRANSLDTKLSTSPVPMSPLAPAEQSLDSFLAHIRKTGVDLLFPVSSQDLVIACIYSIINLKQCFFVKEIVDCLIAIKDSRIFPEFNEVSKTKFRGIIALLRHCNALIVENLSPQAIQLIFHPQISSFIDLRKFHDEFLLEYATKNQVELSEMAKKEMLWGEEMFSQEKITEIQHFVENVKHQIESILIATFKSQDSQDSQPDNSSEQPRHADEQSLPKMVQINPYYSQPYLVDNTPRTQSSYPYYQPEMMPMYCPPPPQYISPTVYTPSPQPLPYSVQYQSIPKAIYSNYNYNTNPQLQGQLVIPPQVLQQSTVPNYIHHQNLESSIPVVPYSDTLSNQFVSSSGNIINNNNNNRGQMSSTRNSQQENSLNSHKSSHNNNNRRQFPEQNRTHFSKK